VRIEKLTREYVIDVRWRAFPLHLETPEEGMTLEQLFAGRPMDIQGIQARLRKTAEELGLPFGKSDRLYNTRLAQELGLWAESEGKGEAFHTAVFKAYFVQGSNVSEIPLLVELAESVGLPADEAEKILVTGAFKAAVDRDWAVSRALQVTAVPTFILNGNRLIGAQSYEAFEGLMDSAGVKKR
jgi:predicted DsbA family dithiol-disulfide isomerase